RIHGGDIRVGAGAAGGVLRAHAVAVARGAAESRVVVDQRGDGADLGEAAAARPLAALNEVAADSAAGLGGGAPGEIHLRAAGGDRRQIGRGAGNGGAGRGAGGARVRPGGAAGVAGVRPGVAGGILAAHPVAVTGRAVERDVRVGRGRRGRDLGEVTA